ncbi:uncharacterized protein LOC144527451 isoform X3 [Sander vitreus]
MKLTLNAVAALQRLHPVALESFTPSLEVLHFPERHGDEQRQAGGVLQRGDVSDFQDTDVSPEPTVVITPIQGLPQRGAAAPLKEKAKNHQRQTTHRLPPNQEPCQCRGNEGDIECTCICFIPDTPISQRPGVSYNHTVNGADKVHPSAYASANVSVNTEDIDEAFECGQILDCFSTNSSFETVVPINCPEQITLLQDEALFEFCAETTRRHTASDVIHDQIESKVHNLHKNINSLANTVATLQTTNAQLFDIVTALGAALDIHGRGLERAEARHLQRAVALNTLLTPLIAIFQKTITEMK